MDWENFMVSKCHRINYSCVHLKKKIDTKKKETHNLTKIIKIFLTKIFFS